MWVWTFRGCVCSLPRHGKSMPVLHDTMERRTISHDMSQPVHDQASPSCLLAVPKSSSVCAQEKLRSPRQWCVRADFD